MSQVSQNNFQFAPLRSLDDFLLSSARFQLPQFGDFEKWGNRVVKNLLYYQTNYFILGAAIFLLVSLIHPAKIGLGVFLVAAISYALLSIYGPNKSPSVPPQIAGVNKYAVVALLLCVAHFFLYMFEAVLIVLFAFLLPISSKFSFWTWFWLYEITGYSLLKKVFNQLSRRRKKEYDDTEKNITGVLFR